MDIYQIIDYAAGMLIIINTVPQLLKMLKTKEVDDVSLGMFFLIISSQILWLIYGFHLNNMPLILTNGLGAILVTFNISLIFKYRKVSAKN